MRPLMPASKGGRESTRQREQIPTARRPLSNRPIARRVAGDTGRRLCYEGQMSTGHIIPGWDAHRDPPPSAAGGRPAPPEPSHAARARTLVAGHTRGALSTLAVGPAG